MIRKFVLFDSEDNHNKEWIIEYDPQKTIQLVSTRYGRVGSTYQSTSKTMSLSDIESKIREKHKKGYNEVELHTITQTTSSSGTTGNPNWDRLIAIWNKEAGMSINSYLATTVDQLSINQIAKARTILSNIKPQMPPKALADQVKLYYNTIPTQLPRKIDIDELCREFIHNLNEHDTRLQQLESAIQQNIVVSSGGNPLTAIGNVELVDLDQSVVRQIETYAHNTGCKDRKISIYGVNIHDERKAYEAETFGDHNKMTLFHGTQARNIRHILRTGIIIPTHAANGSRFGRGIYLSDKYQRSRNYVGGNSLFMFVVDAKIGTPWVNSGSDSSLTKAPNGFHSVKGTGSWSGLGDEYIVYLPSQQTIRAIIHIE